MNPSNPSQHLPLALSRTALFAVCTVCWALQSWPALLLYWEGADIVKQRSVPAPHLALPQLLLCPRFPFTQAGLSSLGPAFNRDLVLSYMRQWLDPALGAESPDDESPGGQMMMSAEERNMAEGTIAQLLPNGRLKQRLEQLMPQCQDMLSSCVLGAHQLSGYDCCRMVQPWLATPRGGICWPFVGNLSSIQGPMDYPRGIQLTFQISRASFAPPPSVSGPLVSSPPPPSSHPGLDVHLVPAEMHSRLRVAASLRSDSASAFSLADKRALRLGIRKLISLPSPTNCPRDAEQIQRGQMVAGISAGMVCMLERAIEHCGCVPMVVVLWTLQNDLDSTFLRRFNASSICTVGEFGKCVHPFVEWAMEPAWSQYPVPAEGVPELRSAIEKCKKESPVTCPDAQFPARAQQRDLPAEYRNTQDFVSRISISFDSFVVTEQSTAKEMDMFRLLSTLGYNLFLWFAIGYLLWSFCRCFHCGSAPPSGPSPTSSLAKVGPSGNNNRVEPKSPMVAPHHSAPPRALPPPAPESVPTTNAAHRNGTLGGGAGESLSEEDEGRGGGRGA